MPKLFSPFRRRSDNWVVNSVSGGPSSLDDNVEAVPQECVQGQAAPRANQTYRTSSWSLLRLLLWKNFKLLVRNKANTATEVLFPLLFTILLVAIRVFGVRTQRFDNATIFESFPASDLPATVPMCCNEIYFAPNLPVVRDLMEHVRRDHFSSRYAISGFESETDLLKAYANSSSGMYVENEDGELSSTVLAGVVFTNMNEHNSSQFPQHIEYSLRFPAALRSQSGLLGERFSFGMKEAWFTEILYPIIQPFGPRAKDQATGGEPGYWTEGFLYLQNAIEKELIKALGKDSHAQDTKLLSLSNASILLERFPYPPYLEDEFLVILQPFLPLVLMMSFIYSATSITKTLVIEKERRIHESMKMMGLTNGLHWAAWFITFILIFALSILIITVLLKVHLPVASKSSGLAVLPKSDPTLVFFCLLVHGFQLIGFCFLVAALFKTANAAAITAAIVWFVLFLPFPFLQPRYPILSSRVKILWCLFTNIGVSFCCQVFCMFEGSQEGAQWSNMFKGVTPDDPFCVADCVFVMLFNGLVYFVAARYISVVWPGEFGVAREWYFLFKKSFWLGSKTDMKVLEAPKNADICDSYERTPKSLVPGIQIRDLGKTYGEVTAIDGINLTLYRNETFCLLGKNGAGKSSLVAVLTGLYPPTFGTAVVNRHDIRTDMASIRQSLGVCPQHNILFEELTVYEHLEFFSCLKGLQGEVMREEVDRMMAAVGLEHKRNAPVNTLSGGMKRRLCVGIAFCGGSQVVILDEPSSGLDVEARRAIWDLIQTEKVGRTVLLTTHFMEEAELLGDRIAIMVNGRVPCCGSPLFLNNKYSGGYNLTIVMDEERPHAGVTDFVKVHVPEATLIRNSGKELTYSLPQAKCSDFPLLFDSIENNQKSLGVETYGARLTSMEDIFIRVNASACVEQDHNCAAKDAKPNDSNLQITFINGSKLNSDRIVLPRSESCRNKSTTLFLQQFMAVMMKKVKYLWRRRGLVIGQCLLPMGYLALVLVVVKTIPGVFDPPAHRFELDHYEAFGKTVTPFHCSDSNSSVCSSYADYLGALHKATERLPGNSTFVGALLEKQKRQSVAAFNSKFVIGFDAKIEENGSSVLTAFFNNQPLHTPPLALNLVTNAILKMLTVNHSVAVTNHPFPYTNLDTQDTGTYWTVGFHVGYNTAFALTFVVAVFATFLVKENVIGATHLQRISGLNPAAYWISNFAVDLVNYLLPCVGLLVVFAIFSESTDFLSWSLQGHLFLLFFAFGWALIPVVYVMSRWFTIPAVGFAACGVSCAFSGFISILTITILELPQINQVDLATVLHRIFLIFPTYALGRGITQMSVNKKLQEKCAGFNLEFLCDAAPDTYCCVKLRANYLDWQEVGIGKNLVYMVCVGVAAIVTLVVIECTAFHRLKRRRATGCSDEQFNATCQEDDEVFLERQRVMCSGSESSEAVLVRELSKSYGSNVAVDRLTFGVQHGQCFGLLGTNGAGKSSTFKMLVGETAIGSGDAFICSYSVTRQKRKTHKIIGYCPQFDALLGELTGRETLTLFARLRGVPEAEIPGQVDDIAKELAFEQYVDRIVERYSGGNKRKLSTAVALIGDPKVVFLDEPTAGMDPLARRRVWAAISSRLRDHHASVILTSHSLEECEVLCSRLAIMKNGRMQCLGSPQQLKHKFGDGFSVVVQIKGANSSGVFGDEVLQSKSCSLSQMSSTSTLSSLDANHSVQAVDSFLRSQLSPATECTLTSTHANYLYYHIKPPDHRGVDCQSPKTSNLGWSALFRAMENVKHHAGISAYSISQISLEQVFLSV